MRYPYFTAAAGGQRRGPWSIAAHLAAGLLLLLLPSLPHRVAGQAFTVTGTTPARQATAAIPTDPFSLNFSQPVDPATWDGITVFAAGKHAINTKGTGSNNGRVIVTLASPPAPGSEISLTIPASVRSQSGGGMAGVPLSNPSVIHFTVAAGAGAGTFALSDRVLVPGADPADVQLGDLDGDGDLDACVASRSTGLVEVMMAVAISGGLSLSIARQVSGIPGCDRIRFGDLDRDGDLDLVCSSATDVVICLNDGTGHFSPPMSTGQVWGDPHVDGCADVDADGDLDIYVSDHTNNRIRVLTNDGASGFSSATDIPCPGGPVSVACTDMNNDGRPDFVAACRDNGQVAILLWQLSQWLPARLVTTGLNSHPSHVAAGDVDGDGFSDFVVSCDGDDGTSGSAPVRGSVQQWSSRTPTAATRYIRRAKTSEAEMNIRLADVDGDGDRDVLCVEDAALITCFNGKYTAQGTFSDGGSAAFRGVDKNGQDCTGPRRPPGSAHRLASGDLDGDGDIDVVTLGDEAISVMENTPVVPITGLTPAPLGVAPRPVGPIKWSAPEVLRSDRFSGVVLRDDHGHAFTPSTGLTLSSGADGSVALLLPAVQKVREAAARMTVPAGGRTVSGAAIRPFSWDFDTRPDPSNGVFVSDGSALALAPGEISTMGDWDGDGASDQITARSTCPGCSPYDVVMLKKARLAAGWSPPVTISATPMLDFTPSLIRCADLNADGHLDVVLAGITTGAGAGAGPHVKVFDGASGQLVQVDDYAISEAAVAMVLADVDHDGALDIVVATANTVQAKGCKCVTRSNISNNRSFPTPGPVRALSFDPGDPTREAALYLAIGSGPGGGPHVRRVPVDNTGVPRTDEATRFTSLTGNPADVTLADLDGDGLPEAIAALTSKHAINTKGTGSNNGRVISTGAGSGPTQVCAGDIDGDDDRDLVVVCPGTSTLWIGVNDGAGLFSVTRTVAVGAVPQQAWLDDCDDDGDRDVVVRCADGSVRVFEVGPPTGLDLIISTPVTVPNGLYNSITVLDSGVATLSPIAGGAIAGIVVGAVRVKNGGMVRGNVVVNSAFVLEAGATMEIAQAAGLHPTTGPITGAGTVSLSPNAVYVYTGTGAQETGAGLPPVVAGLLLGNDLTQLTLTNPVVIAPSFFKSGCCWEIPVCHARMLDPNFSALPGTPKKRVVSNGKLTLGSSAAGTALIDVRTLEVIGDVTVQTWISAMPEPRGYRHFSPPVGGMHLDDLIVTSATGAPVYAPVVNPAFNTAADPLSVRPYPTAFGFDEARPAATSGFAAGYYSPDALTAPCPLGRGLSMYVPGKLTWSTTGPVTSDNVAIGGLTNTPDPTGAPSERAGWHIVGNPFANMLCWDSVTVPAGLSAAIFVWESTGGANGRYLTRANGLGSLPGGLLGVGQGFFCHVTDPATPPGGLTLLLEPEQTVIRSLNDTRKGILSLIRRPVPRPLLTVTLGATGAPAAALDETTLYFQGGATAGLDDAFDGAKPGRNVGVPTLATLSPDGATELALNGLAASDLAAGATVELLLDVPTPGTYALRVGELRFLDGQRVVLLDRLTGARHDLLTTPTVALSAARAGEMRGRFAVEFNGGRVLGTPAGSVARTRLMLFPNPAHDAVRVVGAAAGQRVQILDGVGRVVRTAMAGAELTTLLPLTGLAPGVYVVRSGAQARRLVVE